MKLGFTRRLPIVASGIGGIRDQVIDGESGLLLDDPSDLPQFGRLVRQLLNDPARASDLGTSAAQRAAQFLPDLHLTKWATLLTEVAPTTPAPSPSLSPGSSTISSK